MVAEEEYGRAVVRIDLDESEAEADAQSFGPRLQRVLSRATRNIGRAIRTNIAAGLHEAALSVQVTPDLDDFTTRVQDALALQDLTIPVSPEISDFAAQVQAALPGGALTVPVSPDVADFEARVRAALPGGGLTVPVSPEVADFAARVQAALPGGALTVPVHPDVADFADRVRTALAGADLTVPVTPDLTGLDASLRAHVLPDLPVTLVPDLDRLNRAIRGHKTPELTVSVIPDLDRFDARLLAGLRSLTSINIPVEPDLTGFVERLRALLAGEEVSIRVVPDLDDFDARIRAHRPPDVTVHVDPDVDRFGRALAGLGGIASSVGKGLLTGLKFGAMGIAAAGAAQGVIAFTSALAPAVGIVAAAPAAFLALKAASATLKLALSGVGDAFGAALTGDAKEFEKSLEGLSPAARAAAREVRALKPAFDSLKKSVQDAFFKPLKGQITAAAKALGGPLKSGMTQVSGEFGRLASAALGFAKSSSAVTLVSSVFGGLKTQLGSIKSDTVDRLLTAVSNFAAATLPAFNGLGAGIDGVANRFAGFLERATESGKALSWVQGALAVFHQLGTIASNVGGILKAVFSAANAVGGGLLNNLATITGKFEEFVKSAKGAEAIKAIFATISQIAVQVGPILTALVAQLGGIAPALGPIFTSLGPAIVSLINALGPALAAIGPSLATVGTALADAFAVLASSGVLTAVGQVVGTLLTALAPLLPLVASLASTVVGVLAPAFQAVLAVLSPVISAVVGALMPVLPPLAAAFQQIATALIPLGVAIGQVLGQAITALAPLLSTLAAAVAQVVVAFIPFVQQITAALLPVLPPLMAAFQAIVAAVIPLIPPIASLLAALGPLAAKIVELLAPLAQFVATAVAAVVIEILVPIISKVVSVLTTFVNMLTTVVGYITAFVSAAITGFQTIYNVATTTVPRLVGQVVSFFASLPGKAIGVLRALVSGVPGVLRSMASAGLSAVRSFVSNAVSFFRSLPGKARSALSGARSALVSVGKDLIMGMINGVKSAAGALVSAAKHVVSGAIDAAKSVLDINSPSKVFIKIGHGVGEGFVIGLDATAKAVRAAAKRVSQGVVRIGKDIGPGFIKSLTGTSSQIKSTTDKLASDIKAAFKGTKTSLDDQLVQLVGAGNKKLQSLAAQRDALVKKLADAQKYAADTTQKALATGSVSTLIQGEGEDNIDTLLHGLRRALNGVKSFTTQVNVLAKRGLRKDLLQQVIDLGPQQGAALARSLTEAAPSTLKRINSLQADLVKSSTKLGRTSADVLFDAGKQAGAGFLAGLKAQKTQIEQLMLDIAKGMQRAIRAALRIKSPSQVFRDIGHLTGDGLQIGFLDRIATLQRAAVSAADSVAKGVAGSFAVLPALITQSLGTVNGDVLNQLRNSLPVSLRGLLAFADGGVIDRPTVGLLGEAGKEVVIPMTRPNRARQLADESGLTDMLAGGRSARGGSMSGRSVVQNNTFTINEAGDGHATAHRVVTRLALAAGGL